MLPGEGVVENAGSKSNAKIVSVSVSSLDPFIIEMHIFSF